MHNLSTNLLGMCAAEIENYVKKEFSISRCVHNNVAAIFECKVLCFVSEPRWEGSGPVVPNLLWFLGFFLRILTPIIPCPSINA